MHEEAKILHKIEETVLVNQALIKIIKSFFEDETTNQEEKQAVLEGLKLIVSKQQKLLELIKTLNRAFI